MVIDGVVSFEDHFEQVEDPRVVGRCTHSLHSILFIAVTAKPAASSPKAASASTSNPSMTPTTPLKSNPATSCNEVNENSCD